MRKLPRDVPRPSGQPLGVAGQSTLHESAWLHVTGTARYIDDLPEPEGLLHAAVGMQDRRTQSGRKKWSPRFRES